MRVLWHSLPRSPCLRRRGHHVSPRGRDRRIKRLSATFDCPNGRQRHEVLDTDASQAVTGGQDDPDARIVVEKHLTIAPARTDRATTSVPDGDDGRELPRAACSGVPQGHQLGARPAGEVIQIDAAVHLAVHTPHRGPMVWTPSLSRPTSVFSSMIALAKSISSRSALVRSSVGMVIWRTLTGHCAGTTQSLGTVGELTLAAESSNRPARDLAQARSPETSIPYGGSST